MDTPHAKGRPNDIQRFWLIWEVFKHVIHK